MEAKIDGLQPAYYNSKEDRYITTEPVVQLEDWQPVLFFRTSEDSDRIVLTPEMATWMLPDIAKLISRNANWSKF